MDLISTLTTLSYDPIVLYLDPRDLLALATSCRHMANVMSDDSLPIWQRLYDIYRPTMNPYPSEAITRSHFIALSGSFIVRSISCRALFSLGDYVIHPHTPLNQLTYAINTLHWLEYEDPQMNITWPTPDSLIIEREKQNDIVINLNHDLLASDVFRKGDTIDLSGYIYRVIDIRWIRWCSDCKFVGRLWPYRTQCRKSPCHRFRPISSISDPNIVDNLFPNLISNLKQHPRMKLRIGSNNIEMQPSLSLPFNDEADDLLPILNYLEQALSSSANHPTNPVQLTRPLFPNFWNYIKGKVDFHYAPIDSVFPSLHGFNYNPYSYSFSVWSGVWGLDAFTYDRSDDADDTQSVLYTTLHDVLLDLEEFFDPERLSFLAEVECYYPHSLATRRSDCVSEPRPAQDRTAHVDQRPAQGDSTQFDQGPAQDDTTYVHQGTAQDDKKTNDISSSRSQF
uniref:F-box domain-containing protein n=1 Tax=Spongospora subterranea TaxID=70186 RepID=A0A0H5QR48_9EUKA|eukprot:CRZ04550.1 hypothetical protein [Spongospora subterranea]